VVINDITMRELNPKTPGRRELSLRKSRMGELIHIPPPPTAYGCTCKCCAIARILH
jgi:hypothetical protein